MSRGNVNYWYGFEAIGTTRQLTNSQTQVTDSYAFDAWGNELAAQGSTVNPYRYVGKQGYYLDAESALMLLGVRYYGAHVGQFLSLDPLMDGLNWYLYVNDNPLTRVDPQGLNGPGAPPWIYPRPPRPQPKPSPIILSWPSFGDLIGPYFQLSCGIGVGIGCFLGTWHIRNDKFRHCVCSCAIAGQCGRWIAIDLGFAKEFCDLIEDELGIDIPLCGHADIEDIKANFDGINCAPPFWVCRPSSIMKRCVECCMERGYLP